MTIMNQGEVVELIENIIKNRSYVKFGEHNINHIKINYIFKSLRFYYDELETDYTYILLNDIVGLEVSNTKLIIKLCDNDTMTFNLGM